MCELCADNLEQKLNARKQHIGVAQQLEQLALLYRELATGLKKPHTEDVRHAKALAKALMREFLESWI